MGGGSSKNSYQRALSVHQMGSRRASMRPPPTASTRKITQHQQTDGALGQDTLNSINFPVELETDSQTVRSIRTSVSTNHCSQIIHVMPGAVQQDCCQDETEKGSVGLIISACDSIVGPASFDTQHKAEGKPSKTSPEKMPEDKKVESTDKEQSILKPIWESRAAMSISKEPGAFILPSPIEKTLRGLEEGKGWKNPVLEDGTGFLEVQSGRQGIRRTLLHSSGTCSVPKMPASKDTLPISPIHSPATTSPVLSPKRLTSCQKLLLKLDECEGSQIAQNVKTSPALQSGPDSRRTITDPLAGSQSGSVSEEDEDYSLYGSIGSNRSRDWENADRAKIILHNMQLEREVAFLQAKLERLTKPSSSGASDSKDDDNYSLASSGQPGDSKDFGELRGLAHLAHVKRPSSGASNPFHFSDGKPARGPVRQFSSKADSDFKSEAGDFPSEYRPVKRESYPLNACNQSYSSLDNDSKAELRDDYNVYGIDLNPKLHNHIKQPPPNVSRQVQDGRARLKQMNAQISSNHAAAAAGGSERPRTNSKHSKRKLADRTKKKEADSKEVQLEKDDKYNSAAFSSHGVHTRSTPEPQNEMDIFSKTLQTRWAEVEFTLRQCIKDDNDIKYVMAACVAGLLFLDQLEDKAADLGILRGALIRMVMPYNADTSVADQAAVSRANLPVEFQKRFTQKEFQFLVSGAISLRKLIRVKIADDADLDQARTALETISKFLKTLQDLADRKGTTLLAQLQAEEHLDKISSNKGEALEQSYDDVYEQAHAKAQGNTKLLKKKLQQKNAITRGSF